jgi:hypothetical protein
MIAVAVVTTRHQQRRYDHPPSLGPPKGTRQGRFDYEKVTSPVFESPKRGIRRFSTSVRSYRKRETKAGSDSYTLREVPSSCDIALGGMIRCKRKVNQIQN